MWWQVRGLFQSGHKRGRCLRQVGELRFFQNKVQYTIYYIKNTIIVDVDCIMLNSERICRLHFIIILLPYGIHFTLHCEHGTEK